MELKTKSTRSELKENLLANELEIALKWAMGHLPVIFAGLGALVVGALISSVFIIRRSEARDRNWVRLAQGQSQERQKDNANAEKIFNEIKDNNPGTAESLFATYYLGTAALDEKKYGEAVRFFSDAVAKAGKSPLKPLALTNLAFSYEENKDYQSAANTCKQFMNSYAEHFLAARNQLEWGRVLMKAGEIDAAKETLGQLVDLYPTSPWAENARQIMDKLASR